MPYKVNKSISGKENLYALIQHTWPGYADVLTEENVELTYGSVVNEESGEVTLTLSTTSDLLIGQKEVTYTVTNLNNIVIGYPTAFDMDGVNLLLDSLINHKLSCLPSELVLSDIVETEDGWSTTLSTVEGALTVIGSVDINITKDRGYGELLIARFKGRMIISTYQPGTLEISLDRGLNWEEITQSNTTVLGADGDQIIYIRSLLEEPVDSSDAIAISTVSIGELIGIDQWWESSRPIKIRAGTSNFYVPYFSPPNITDYSEMFEGCDVFNANFSQWDTSKVINMSRMFANAKNFSCNLSNWDTGNVTDMSRMFANAKNFSCNLSNWDTSNVTDMSRMFSGAADFDCTLSNWDTSNVTTMHSMFSGAKQFNGDIGHWNTSKVIDMTYMFDGASLFNCDIGGWDTSSVKNMYSMFGKAISFNQDISKWDVSLASIIYMFNNASSFNQDLSTWCVTHVTSDLGPTGFDTGTTSWTLPKPNWGYCPVRVGLGEDGIGETLVARVLGNLNIRSGAIGILEYSFNDIEYLPVTSTNFNIATPETGDGRIYLRSIDDVSPLEPITLSSSASNLRGVERWWTSARPIRFSSTNKFFVPAVAPPNIIDFSNMFNGCTNFDEDISKWDVSHVTNMSSMFSGASKFKSDLSNWNIGNVTDLYQTFYNCAMFESDLSEWNTSNVTNMSEMFYGCTLFNSDLNNWDVSNVSNLVGMFRDCRTFNSDLNNWDVSNVTDISYMFYGCYEFNGDLSNWDVSNIINFNRTFYNCHKFNQDLSKWDMSSAEDLTYMFYTAKEFNQDIGNWKTVSFKTMNYMFNNASSFNQDLSNWCVNHIQSSPTGFDNGTTSWTLPKPSWGFCPVRPGVGDAGHGEDLVLVSGSTFTMVAPAESISYSVDGGETYVTMTSTSVNISITGGKLTRVHLRSNEDVSINEPLEIRYSGIDFRGVEQWWESARPIRFNVQKSSFYVPESAPPNITDYSEMFSNANVFNSDLSKWDTSNVTNMSKMFKSCANFNQDLSKWDVSSVTDMAEMFSGCSVFQSDLSNWDVSKVTTLDSIFYTARAFNSDLNNWDVSNVTDMNRMFYGCNIFDSDLSKWDTSKVSRMGWIFRSASEFNGDISTWDVSSVTDMHRMFNGASKFNQDISGWDVASATNMEYMFQSAKEFNQDLSNWCVNAFSGTPTNFAVSTTAWTLPKPNWGFCPIRPGVGDDGVGEDLILRVTGTFDITLEEGGVVEYSIDEGVTYVESTGGRITIDDTKATRVYIRSKDEMSVNSRLIIDSNNSTSTFRGVEQWWISARPIRINISSNSFFVPEVAPPNITDYSRMFARSSYFNSDLSKWDVSKVTDMSEMFSGCSRFNSDLSNWDISNVTNISDMFRSCGVFDSDVGKWDTSKVTNMSGLFFGARAFNQDLSGWDTSNVTTMRSMFSGAATFDSDITTWDVSNVTDMTEMFYTARAFNQDISGWDVSNVTSMVSMFNGASKFNQDLSNWCVNAIRSQPNSFAASTTAWKLPKPNWGFCPVRPGVGDKGYGDVLIARMHSSIAVTAPENGGVSYSVDDGKTFIPMVGHTIIEREVPGYKVQFRSDDSVDPEEPLIFATDQINATNFRGIEQWWDATRPVRINISSNSFFVPEVAPPNVTDYSRMFASCNDFRSDISKWDTSKVTNMDWMFQNANKFDVDLGNWDVSNVVSMLGTFYFANAFNHDLSGWCVSNIPSEPNGFAHGVIGWTLPKPTWGTCPSK